MQRDDILEFLQKIDSHLLDFFSKQLAGEKFELRIFGKSALMLSGLSDSIGTNDIDILRVEGQVKGAPEIIRSLEAEFGKTRIKAHGYYLEFIDQAIVFLPQKPTWIPIQSAFKCVTVKHLDASYVVASKLFSALSRTPRKRDKQDIRAALDQHLVSFQEVCRIADQIFDFHLMDSRSERFPDIYEYITKELMADYGEVHLRYHPED